MENNSSDNILRGITHNSLPVIDFSSWSSSDTRSSDRKATARELVNACHHDGFVYIRNHGVPTELLNEAFKWSKRFFDLPTEEKKKLQHPKGSTTFRGYTWPGTEKVSAISDEKVLDGQDVVDFNESYGLGSDDNTREPNIWIREDVLPGFHAFALKFYWECWRTSQNVLRALALGLGLDDEDFLLKFHTGHENELSLRYYPVVRETELLTQGMRRLSAHTDFDSFTLLFQDDCGGLEVEKRGHPGEFLHVDPIPDTLVMNIGDALARWSNDYLKSTKHRVTLPPLEDRYTGHEKMTRKRYSIPYFIAPTPDTIMKCLPACCDEIDNPPKYEPIAFGDWFHERASKIFGV